MVLVELERKHQVSFELLIVKELNECYVCLNTLNIGIYQQHSPAQLADIFRCYHNSNYHLQYAKSRLIGLVLSRVANLYCLT